ncbi:hypothetical protein [Streptomyces caniscabiei]|uniref:hypothetical protein n=1 Tax=Streptomyces caniscabiei TaxID=2746961 RepID=UPI0029B154C3|nr:hypothetical protein [Streptomyces caniscabiei]MDX2943310.1 hypothetical protein [Streptomyces caniscabiei]
MIGDDERERILNDAAERIGRLIIETAEEVEQIRSETEQITGTCLVGEQLPVRPRIEDAKWADVHHMRGQCAAFVEAAGVLEPFLRDCPERTVGAVLKTAPREVSWRLRQLLDASGLSKDLT